MELIDLIIVEDEIKLAELHVEFIKNIPGFNPVGIASSLKQAYTLIEQYQPKLILLDNYLPDGQGIELFEYILNNKIDSYVIFITASLDINICSQAIRHGAFNYLIKPISYDRLKYTLERFKLFINQQQNSTTVNQRKVDELLQLHKDNYEEYTRIPKGIEEQTLEKVQELFIDNNTALTADEVATILNMGKTTARRYLEYCLQTKFLCVNMEHGKIGRPERKYKRY